MQMCWELKVLPERKQSQGLLCNASHIKAIDRIFQIYYLHNENNKWYAIIVTMKVILFTIPLFPRIMVVILFIKPFHREKMTMSDHLRCQYFKHL